MTKKKKQTKRRAQIFEERLRLRGLYELVAGICIAFGVTVEEVGNECRTKAVRSARGEAMRQIRESRGWSFAEIGALFGDRHHSTVMLAIQRGKVREARLAKHRKAWHRRQAAA